MSEKANGQSIGLIETLEQNPLARRMDESNPLYWYIHLDQLGKMAQSAETVEKAINEFAACNPCYRILKVTLRNISRTIYVQSPYETTALTCNMSQRDSRIVKCARSPFRKTERHYRTFPRRC